MISWGMDLAKRPSQGKGAEAVGLYLLVALTVITGYYQQRQMTARTPAAAQNPQTQMMGRIFPLFFGFISLQVPAGVVLYFVVSNLWQIGQQAIIFRGQDAAPTAAKPSTSAAAKSEGSSDKPSGGNGGKGSSTGSSSTATESSGNSGSANRSRRRRKRRKGR
jgi:YidC/Oxa1 family membrane protein insertase